MSGPHPSPGSSGLISLLTFEDILYVFGSIIFGMIAMYAVYHVDPRVDRNVLSLFGTVVAHIPFVYFVVLNGIDPEQDPTLVGHGH
jgi:hypothetical protein